MNDFKTVIYTIYNYLKTVICNFSKLALPTQQAFLLALWLYYNTLQFFCQNAEKFKFFSKIGGILNCFLPFFRIPGCWVVFLDTDCKTNHPNTQKQILLKLTHFHHKTHPTLKAPHPYPLIHIQKHPTKPYLFATYPQCLSPNRQPIAFSNIDTVYKKSPQNSPTWKQTLRSTQQNPTHFPTYPGHL